MNDNLLPCPFCGGEASVHIVRHEQPLRKRYSVAEAYCMVCLVAKIEKWGDTDEDAIKSAVKAWNTRADDYRQAAEYWQRMYEEAFAERTCKRITHGLERDREVATVSWTCSECGAHIGRDYRYCPMCGAKVVK